MPKQVAQKAPTSGSASKAVKKAVTSKAAAKVTKPKGTVTAMPSRQPRSKCPINLLLEAVGDSWSLLIIRDLMFRGHSTYKAFLNSEERIATNILADRLVRLEQSGLISKQADPEDARKYIYKLTEKGADLAPVLVEIMLWSNRHHITDTPKDFLAALQKNKAGFTQRIVKDVAGSKAPVMAIKPADKDETLSLF
ncbi:MAG: helix-turn-helix domain-containing protein [Asticcacaulis sp.]